MWKEIRKVVAVAAAMMVPMMLAAPAQAGSVYDNKVVTLIVPNSPSGKMTQYARLIAPYIAKYIGASEVRVENHQGGGGLKGSNLLWTSKPDGMTMAFTNVPALIMAQLAGSPGVQFDATKFTYLGRAASEPRVVVVGANSAIKSAADLKTLDKPFVYASQGTDEDFYTMAVLADSIGYKLKIVTGYEGNADTQLAVIKGDADGQMMAWVSAKAAVDNGDQRVIMVVGTERLADLPDVPTAIELVNDEGKKATLEAITSILELSRTFFGPPDMDAAATKEMRAGITAALSDPEMLAEADKRGFNINAATGEAQAEAVKHVVKASQSLTPIFKDALKSIK
jgi:tripartite-type tricarboxylate transporter receptor subunit TctC